MKLTIILIWAVMIIFVIPFCLGVLFGIIKLIVQTIRKPRKAKVKPEDLPNICIIKKGELF